MEEFYSGTISLYDTLHFSYKEDLIFICQETRLKDESIEQDIKRRIKHGMAYTYFNLMKVLNEICQGLRKMHTNHLAAHNDHR